MIIENQIYPSPSTTYPGLKIIVVTQPRPHPTHIQILRFSSRLYMQAPRFTSPLHPGHVSSQTRSLYFHFTTVLVMFHLHPGPQIAS